MRLFAFRRWCFLFAFALGVVGASHCSSTKSAPVASASKVIGAGGGSVASADGTVRIDVPAGALDNDTTITIAPTTTGTPNGAGQAYEIGPSGTQFHSDVTMTFRYAGVDLAGHGATELRVGTIVSGSWQAIGGYATDANAQTVSGTTTHLSVYGLFFVGGSGQVCVDRFQGCLSSGPAGSGCVASPSCAESRDGLGVPLCARYPDSTQTACSNVTNGIAVTCCFPAGTPSCLKATNGCSVSATGGGCTPPSCSDICGAELPGSTVQSCTPDANNSNTAVCCLAAGSPLPSGGGSDGGSSAPSDSGSSGPGNDAGSCVPTTASCQAPQTDAYDCPNGMHPNAQCMFMSADDAGSGSIFCCVP
jgi:hypothetical protein